jgi:hypothetical protein
VLFLSEPDSDRDGFHKNGLNGYNKASLDRSDGIRAIFIEREKKISLNIIKIICIFLLTWTCQLSLKLQVAALAWIFIEESVKVAFELCL